MSLYVPEAARPFFWIAGGEWPDGDEDKMWAVSKAWEEASQQLDALVSGIEEAKSAAMAAYPSGDGADAIGTLFDDFLQGDQSLASLAKSFHTVSDSTFDVGTNLQSTKISMIVSLCLLAVEIAWAWLFPPTAPAVESAAIGTTRSILKFLGDALQNALERAWSKLGFATRGELNGASRYWLEHILSGDTWKGMAGQSLKFKAKTILPTAKGMGVYTLKFAEGAMWGPVTDAIIQGAQMAQGKRHSFNWTEFGASAAGTALGTIPGRELGRYMGFGINKWDKSLGGKLTSGGWGRVGLAAGGATIGATTGVVSNFFGALGAGMVTGDPLGALSSGAGWVGGAARGGIVGGVRGVSTKMTANTENDPRFNLWMHEKAPFAPPKTPPENNALAPRPVGGGSSETSVVSPAPSVHSSDTPVVSPAPSVHGTESPSVNPAGNTHSGEGPSVSPAPSVHSAAVPGGGVHTDTNVPVGNSSGGGHSNTEVPNVGNTSHPDMNASGSGGGGNFHPDTEVPASNTGNGSHSGGGWPLTHSHDAPGPVNPVQAHNNPSFGGRPFDGTVANPNTNPVSSVPHSNTVGSPAGSNTVGGGSNSVGGSSSAPQQTSSGTPVRTVPNFSRPLTGGTQSSPGTSGAGITAGHQQSTVTHTGNSGSSSSKTPVVPHPLDTGDGSAPHPSGTPVSPSGSESSEQVDPSRIGLAFGDPDDEHPAAPVGPGRITVGNTDGVPNFSRPFGPGGFTHPEGSSDTASVIGERPQSPVSTVQHGDDIELDDLGPTPSHSGSSTRPPTPEPDDATEPVRGEFGPGKDYRAKSRPKREPEYEPLPGPYHAPTAPGVDEWLAAAGVDGNVDKPFEP